MEQFIILRLVGVGSILLLATLGCNLESSDQSQRREAPADAAVTKSAVPVPTFDKRFLEIANEYKTYTAIGADARMTYTFCRAAIDPALLKAPVRLSVSGDADTHGRKLYWLYAKEMPAVSSSTGDYTPAKGLNPVGQVVVKEAWHPAEVKDDNKSADDSYRQVSDTDGRVYRAGTQADLFIMYKLDPKTPDTDEGWVYGTVTPDGEQVTCAGVVESCIGCHRDAPHDRLFGLAKK